MIRNTMSYCHKRKKFATHVYVKALSVEEFAVRLAKHFTSLYQQTLILMLLFIETLLHPDVALSLSSKSRHTNHLCSISQYDSDSLLNEVKPSLFSLFPKGSACDPGRADEGADEGAAEGPGRGDEDLCRDGERPCTSHTDVRPQNLVTCTSSCFTFDLRATSLCRYPVA
ncbi:uncharacterized protein LOC126585775 isoform X2 [Malus sylvestris]|uniref:uncharacterized protein LOC126585775 isoform X2 n=1 Tax=Malus sylvestris TaxID=3752 RepID=UPI0021ACA597|nr:uncharacterized protein LOC126585775 isoform X2 [Malus sylvestris]